MVRCWDMAGQVAERRGRDPRSGKGEKVSQEVSWQERQALL